VFETECRSVEETHSHAAKWAQYTQQALLEGRFDSLLFALDGDLGAGKTEWVRGFMQGLGSDRAQDVSSPTYAIVQEYEGHPPVRHLDLYRLSGVEDLEAIGYRDHFYLPGISLVEWMSNIPDAVPLGYLSLYIEMLDDSVRKISVKPHSEVLTAWAQAVWT